MSLQLRAPRAHEREALIDVWVEAWRAVFPDIDFAARAPWLRAHLTELEAQGAQLIAAFLDDAPQGFVTIDPRTGALDQIVVARKAQGARSASPARALMDEAKRRSPGCVRLDVNADNLRALGFYAREGFVKIGEGLNATSGRATIALEWRSADKKGRTMSEFAIRAIAAGDRAQWAPLWQGYQEFYQTSIPEDVSAKTFAKFLDAASPVNAFVAQEEGELIGVVHYIFHESCWTTGPYCYLQDLFTAKTARGRGVGRGLIEAVYAAAQSKGASRVYWLTQETNQTAMLLYDSIAQKSGFIQYRKVF